jgi:hypothetical protein
MVHPISWKTQQIYSAEMVFCVRSRVAYFLGSQQSPITMRFQCSSLRSQCVFNDHYPAVSDHNLVVSTIDLFCVNIQYNFSQIGSIRN